MCKITKDGVSIGSYEINDSLQESNVLIVHESIGNDFQVEFRIIWIKEMLE